jgi:hypothetical protein
LQVFSSGHAQEGQPRLLPVCCPKLRAARLISKREMPVCRHF